jgi:hypothetical protein
MLFFGIELQRGYSGPDDSNTSGRRIDCVVTQAAAQIHQVLWCHKSNTDQYTLPLSGLTALATTPDI